MDRAAHSLTTASRAGTPGERFVAAHVAALQVVAAVLAARPRPAGRGRTMNAWLLLERSAPDLVDWATYFSAGAAKRAGVEAGLDHIVSPQEADALQHVSEQFFHEVADRSRPHTGCAPGRRGIRRRLTAALPDHTAARRVSAA